MTKDFREFLFKGLDVRSTSNKYYTCKRHNDDYTKLCIKVADSHLIPTKYGYALVLDHTRVVFLRDWQVNRNYYGNEVILDKNYFVVKEWGNHSEFSIDDEPTGFEHWVTVAKAQADAENIVKWAK